MRNTEQSEILFASNQDKASLLNALTDTDRPFTRDELESVIHIEFFNDENPLDSDLVDAAISRIMLLEGKVPNADTMQKEREQMIYRILKEILKPI